MRVLCEEETKRSHLQRMQKWQLIGKSVVRGNSFKFRKSWPVNNLRMDLPRAKERQKTSLNKMQYVGPF